MCRSKSETGRRCPCHKDPAKIQAYNAVRRARYHAQKKHDEANNNTSSIQTADAYVKQVPFNMSKVDIAKIRSLFEEYNNSGDRVFAPGTVSAHSSYGTTTITAQTHDGSSYRFDFSEKEKRVLAFKDYGEDEEFITESRPVIHREFESLEKDEELSLNNPNYDTGTVVHNVFNIMNELLDDKTNWNTDQTAAKFLYFGEAFNDVNNALRNKTELNTELVTTLDTIMRSHTLTKATTVYRGIRLKKDSPLRASIKAGTYSDAGYLSTTTNPETAKNFGGGGTENTVVMKLTLPAGTQCYDSSSDSENEITLPRGYDLRDAEWETFS